MPKRIVEVTHFAVYREPGDWPGWAYVVRPWSVVAAEAVWVVEHPVACLCGSLAEARLGLEEAGWTNLGREDGDDPVVQEVWAWA